MSTEGLPRLFERLGEKLDKDIATVETRLDALEAGAEKAEPVQPRTLDTRPRGNLCAGCLYHGLGGAAHECAECAATNWRLDPGA